MQVVVDAQLRALDQPPDRERHEAAPVVGARHLHRAAAGKARQHVADRAFGVEAGREHARRIGGMGGRTGQIVVQRHAARRLEGRRRRRVGTEQTHVVERGAHVGARPRQRGRVDIEALAGGLQRGGVEGAALDDDVVATGVDLGDGVVQVVPVGCDGRIDLDGADRPSRSRPGVGGLLRCAK